MSFQEGEKPEETTVDVTPDITMESSIDDYKKYVFRLLADKEKLDKLIAEYKPKNKFTSEDCILELEKMWPYFSEQWLYETGPQWKLRAVKEAIWESTLHAISKVVADTFSYLENNELELFPNRSSDEVVKLKEIFKFLNNHFRSILADPDQDTSS